MAENHDVREIEANLKRMLNMGPQGTGNGQAKENASSSDKDAKKGDKTGGDNHVKEKKETLPHHHHQPDPGIDMKDTAEQQDSTPKKKKKKPKKKNKQETPEEQAVLEKLTQAQEQAARNRQAQQKQGQANKQTKDGQKDKEEGRKKSSKDEDSDDDSDTGKPVLAGLKTAIKFRYLDEKLTPAIMNELEKHKIFPMRKKSNKFPSAKYFCRLCEYHCDNIPVCRQHYNEARHKRRSEIAVQDKMLKTLPQPSKRHIESLDRILSNIYQQYGLSDQDLQDRADIAGSVKEFLCRTIPGLELRVYGSSLTGFGLKSSDLNLDLLVPEGSNPAQLLTKVYKVLNNSDVYRNVKSNFLAKVPSVLFDSPCGCVHCEISVNSDLAYYTSRLLEVYSKVDPRVRQLAVIFRHWAKLCQVDDQNKGSLPAYTFGLMTVFYLQQCQPTFLPVLWKDLSEVVLKRPKTADDILTMLTNLELEREEWVCENTKTLGELWLDLLLFYGVRFNLSDHVISIRQERLLLRSEKKWKTKRMAIEDPFSVKRNVARTLFSVRIFDYLYNCLRKGCLYFSLPTNQNDVLFSSGKSKDKSQQPKYGQKQTHSAVPKMDIIDKEVPAQPKAITDKGSDTQSEHADQIVERCVSELFAQLLVPKKDSETNCDNSLEPETSNITTDSIAESEKDNGSNVEFALTVSGSSSDFSIKENEFLAECKDNSKESSVESESGSNIKEHSFLSSAEVIGSPEKKGGSHEYAKKDEEDACSEVEKRVENLDIKSDNIDNVIATDLTESGAEKEECVTETDIQTDNSVRENEIHVSDDIGKCDNEIVERLQDGDSVTACDQELPFKDNHFEACVNTDVVTKQNEIGAVSDIGAISDLGAVDNVNSCEESVDQQVNNAKDDLECNEEANILSVYTQEENDREKTESLAVVGDSVNEVSETNNCDVGSEGDEAIITEHTQEENGAESRTESSAIVKDSVMESSEINMENIENDTDKGIIPEHSFLNEEDSSAKEERDENIDEDINDEADIIDHSFLTDESVLTDLLENSQIAEKERTDNGDSKDHAHKRNKAEIDSESVSGSESDMELESPDSSPVRRRKFERPKSPENAEYNFVFSVESLTDGKGPSVFCGICEKEGHLKSNCPEELLPDLKQLPPVTKQHLKLLTNVIKAVPGDFQLSQRELDDREAIRWGLEVFIQELFPDAELSLFGSSKNGFGFHFSDLDICVTFRARNPEDLNFVEVIEALCKKLKTHKSFYNVFPITTAKVPIVKFTHRPTRLEGDISLYNILAQQNTRLLYCYSCIDPRVVTLGYAIKVFAKVCDIGDASKGSLSSYAYMLLLFHYLQHTKPPVIPVLQELRNGDEKAEFMVDGWNAWFYDDLKNLPNVWPKYRHNNQSVGELWLGLFRYYTEEFNIEEQVATIRQFETLTKFEKLWNRKCIAIEDPFDLSHNLGAGLTRKMHKYIMTTIINARELYGTSITGPPDGYNNPADYFFDQSLLAEGELPNDRLCRVCSKIGHIAKECPRVLARKEREAEEKKRREEQRKAQEAREKGGTTPNRGNNQNKQKQPNRSHLGPARSLSDPVDTSPRRPQTRSHMFINRQFSAGADLQSYDNQQGYSPNPRHQGTAYNPSSPQPIPQQTYNRDRRQPSNSPRSYPKSGQPQSPRGFNFQAQGFSPGGFNTQQPVNPFQWMNQNDNSARGNFQQPVQVQNFANMSHIGANQNQNYIPPLMSLPNQMPGNQQNVNRGFRSSPNQKQGYQNRKQQPRSLLTNEDKEPSSPTNRNQAYNRSQQQQQVPGSRRQVTMATGPNRSAGMGVTVNNEYYQGNKNKN